MKFVQSCKTDIFCWRRWCLKVSPNSFEAEQTANRRIDELKHRFSSLETATLGIISQLEAKVKALCEVFDDGRDCMDARIGGIEDYLGLPEGEVQSIWLWDGQNVDCIKYMRGVEYQARDE